MLIHKITFHNVDEVYIPIIEQFIYNVRNWYYLKLQL